MLDPFLCFLYSLIHSYITVVSSRSGKGLRLSFDHKPSLPEEQERIKQAGGFVVQNRVNGFHFQILHTLHTLSAILAVSRSLGDHAMKKYIISDPFVSKNTLVPDSDAFIIVACDGVWDVLQDDEVAKIAIQTEQNEMPRLRQEFPAEDPEDEGEVNNELCTLIAQNIIKEALSRNSTDNITVVVVQL